MSADPPKAPSQPPTAEECDALRAQVAQLTKAKQVREGYDPRNPCREEPITRHQWWSSRHKETCPKCGSAKEVEDSYTNVMFGVFVQKHCGDCGVKWTLKIAEDPD